VVAVVVVVAVTKAFVVWSCVDRAAHQSMFAEKSIL